MTTSDRAGAGVYVHARLPDGTSRLVGRYRLSGAPGAARVGEFAYAGSWLRDRGVDRDTIRRLEPAFARVD